MRAGSPWSVCVSLCTDTTSAPHAVPTDAVPTDVVRKDAVPTDAVRKDAVPTDAGPTGARKLSPPGADGPSKVTSAASKIASTAAGP
ncbi:hypothetical protein [Streptomyces sp. NPDC059371]|uniref:hypothetical protein n=1 Tax=Streptomyces sp. NPDC059371 TaxID=3346812 RepID=UPI0036AEBDDB